MLSSHVTRCLFWAFATLLTGSCAAQVAQAPGTMPGGQHVHAHASRHTSEKDKDHAKAAAAAAPQVPQVRIGAVATGPAAPAEPPSLLDKPAQPAAVTLNDGRLAVKADNSSLTQILDKVSSSTGMKIDGLGRDQRVFGIYGPGNPTAVLSDLLDGAGYNVLILGVAPDGAPREIILSARNNAPAPPVQASSAPQADEDQDDNGNENNYPPEPVMTPMPQQAAPGPVKTPQQILQELQQIRQRQMQQQQQQNPQ